MIGCPVFTPYDEFGEINFSEITKYAYLLSKLKFDCILVGGTTGDWALLTLNQRKSLLLEWVVQSHKHNLKIIFNISDPCLKNVHELLKESNKLDIWCVLIMGPQIFQTSNIIEYLNIASKNSRFMYYHYPEIYGYSNTNLQDVVNMDNCIGLKIVDSDIKLPETDKMLFISDEEYTTDKSTFTTELNVSFLETDILKQINKFTNKNGKKSCIRYFVEKMYNINIKHALYPNISIDDDDLYNIFVKIISD